MKYKLVIGWLYPRLMNTYGDTGNIVILKKRCEWRKIDVEVKKLDLGFKIEDLKKCDLLFMGGAQDKQQKIVANDLGKEKVGTLKEMINNEIPGLFICGAYQFLGQYYKEADGTKIPGLGILDLYTENPGENSPRLIGNIVVKLNESFDFAQDNNDHLIVGFENHGGRTYLGKNVKPLGKVIKGFGNNGDQPRMDGGPVGDKTEGAIYKNSFGTYLHGPILPKNPNLADLLIKLSLEKRYNKKIELSELDDSLEIKARDVIAKRQGIQI